MSHINNPIVHTTETPAPVYVERRMSYCTGCEGAEIEETMAEVLYEGATMAEARRHAHQYWAPMVCASCEDYDQRWEEREAEEDAYEAHYAALQAEFEAEDQAKRDKGYTYHPMTDTWSPPEF